MIEENNIEQLFESGFSDYQVKPDDRLWSKLDEQLEDKELSSMFVDKFKNFKMTPSSQVWKGVEATVFVKGFWDFGLKTMNIYTLTAALAALFTISYFSYENLFSKQSSDANLVENSQVINDRNSNKAIVNELITSEQEDLVDNNKLEVFVSTPPNKEINGNSGNHESDAGFVVTGEEDDDKVYTIVEKEPVDISEQLTLFEKEDNKDNTENSHAKQSTNKSVIVYNEEDDLDIDVYTSVLSDSLKPENDPVDTLLVYDTIVFYDTLIVEKATKKKQRQTSNWTLTPSIGLFSSIPSLKGKSGADENYVTLSDDATTASVSYSFGALVNYDISKWRVSTGVSYTTIYEEFNYETKEIETVPVVKYTLKENGYYMNVVENISYKFDPKFALEFDTISSSYTVHKVEYDEYVVIDTVWRYVLDTNVVEVIDSIKIVDYDTVRVATYDTSYYNGVDTTVYSSIYQNINKYTYLELPLSIGYGFTFNRFTLRPTVGAVFGIMLNAKGKGISLANKNEVYSLSNSELPFMNLQVTAYIGLGLEYKIHDGIDIFIQPFFRRNLTSMYQSSALIEKRFTGLGASFGLNYHF